MKPYSEKTTKPLRKKGVSKSFFLKKTLALTLALVLVFTLIPISGTMAQAPDPAAVPEVHTPDSAATPDAQTPEQTATPTPGQVPGPEETTEGQKDAAPPEQTTLPETTESGGIIIGDAEIKEPDDATEGTESTEPTLNSTGANDPAVAASIALSQRAAFQQQAAPAGGATIFSGGATTLSSPINVQYIENFKGSVADTQATPESGSAVPTTADAVDPAWVHADYLFAGWNTAADGSGTWYGSDLVSGTQAETVFPGADITLYGMWYVKWTFNVNGLAGGGADIENYYIAGSNVSLPGNDAWGSAITGMTKWNTAADGSGTSYTLGQAIAGIDGNTTLYALGTEYTIIYRGWSSVADAFKDITVTYYGDGPFKIKNPADLGYGPEVDTTTFRGWKKGDGDQSIWYHWSDSGAGLIEIDASQFNSSNKVQLYSITQQSVKFYYNQNTIYETAHDTPVITAGVKMPAFSEVSTGWPTWSPVTFVGWAANKNETDEAKIYQPGDLANTSAREFYAIWAVRVTYAANGMYVNDGTKNAASWATAFDDYILTPDNAAGVQIAIKDMSDPLFAGWGYDAALSTLTAWKQVSGPVRTPGDTVTLKTNVILNAQFNGVAMYSSSGMNGNWVSTPVQMDAANTNGYTLIADETAAPLSWASTPYNNKVAKWSIGGTYYDPGETITQNQAQNVDIKAMWKPSIQYHDNINWKTYRTDAQEVGVDLTLLDINDPALASFTKPNGKVFLGWSTSKTGSTGIYKAGANSGFAMKYNANETLYAIWGYEITYNLNAGTLGTSKTVAFLDGAAVPASVKDIDTNWNGPYDTAYTSGTDAFVGWNTAADGSGAWYGQHRLDAGASPKATLTSADAGITLYAIWATKIKYDINGMGGESGFEFDSDEYIIGTDVTVKDVDAPLFDGWTNKHSQNQTFLHWLDAASSTAYDPNGITNTVSAIQADTVLKAVYSMNPTFHLKDAVLGTSAKNATSNTTTITVGDTVPSLTEIFTTWTPPANSKIEFLGWNTKEDGTGDWYYSVPSHISKTVNTTFTNRIHNDYYASFDYDFGPRITLNGAAAITLEAGIDTYTELNAEMTDIDGVDNAKTIGPKVINYRDLNGNNFRGDVGAVDTTVVGEYKISYQCTDTDGYVGRDADRVIHPYAMRVVRVVDTTPPVITLNGDQHIYVERYTGVYNELFATVTDNHDQGFNDLAPSLYHFYAPDDIKTGTLQGAQSGISNQELGYYKVSYTWTDTNGNKGVNGANPKSNHIIRFVHIVDTVKPTGTMTYSNNNDKTLTNQDVTATLKTSEPILTPAGWKKIDETTFELVFTNNKKFTLEIEDLAGNKGSVFVEVKRIDKENPVVQINGTSYPAAGDAGAFQSATITATDGPQWNISKVTLTDTASGTSVNYAWDKVPFDVTADGSYTAQAFDKAGNASEIISFTIDTVAPTATFSYSNNEGLDPTNGDVTVTMTASEPILTPTGWTKQTDTTFTKAYDSNQAFTVDIEDSAGNKGTANGEVKNIDKDAPVVLVNGISFPNAMDVGTYQSVSVNAEDLPQENLDRIEITDTDSGAVSTIVAANLPSGITVSGNYSVQAFDVAGNASAIITLTVDSDAPGAAFSYSTTDPTSGDVTVTLRTTKPINTPAGWTKVSDTEFTLVVTDNGTYPLELEDTLGNKASVYYAVSNIDKVSPVVTLSGTLAAAGGSDYYADVVITATDPDGNLASVTVNKNVKQAANGNKHEETASNIDTYTVVATDLAGNVSDETVFKIVLAASPENVTPDSTTGDTTGGGTTGGGTTPTTGGGTTPTTPPAAGGGTTPAAAAATTPAATGGGTATGNTAAPAGNTDTTQADANPVTIPDEQAALADADELMGEETTATTTSHWSFVNLILLIWTLAAMLVLLLKQAYDSRKYSGSLPARFLRLRVLSIIPFAAAIILFVLTQDMSSTMMAVDTMTIPEAIIAIAQLVLFSIAIRTTASGSTGGRGRFSPAS